MQAREPHTRRFAFVDPEFVLFVPPCEVTHPAACSVERGGVVLEMVRGNKGSAVTCGTVKNYSVESNRAQAVQYVVERV